MDTHHGGEPQPHPGTVRFEIFGAVTGYRGDEPLPLGPFKQRVVLGLLLCRANRVVPVAALRDALWDDDPPRTAHKNLQVYVSALRRLLDPGPAPDATGAHGIRLLHSPPGYRLQIGPDGLDALRFADLVRAGRTAAREGDHATAADLLGRAVRLWRGPALSDLASARVIAAEAERLHEQYLAAFEDWAEAGLALGRHTELVEGIDELARRHPFRERIRHAQMLALFRAGRQTEALAQFDALRQLLARDLGLQPSPVLTRLYESILSGDPGLEVAASTRTPPAGPRAAGRGGLPRDVADFTGRVEQAGALLDLLGGDGSRGTVALSGPVGVGKTALAVHCAHRLGERFADGRVLVCLRGPDGRPRGVAEVLGELLAGAGWTGALPDGPGARAALLRETTAGRAVLFVLDDAVTEAQVGAVLSAVGDAVVVVTGRRYLGGLEGVVHVAVDPMPDDEALRLLGRLIGAGRVTAEPEPARDIVAVCGGLPLAVRIVGAKLAGLRHLTLARYAARLADERRLLDELVAGDLQIRSRLASSYQDLAPRDRSVLERIASRPGTAFTAAEVAGWLDVGAGPAEAAVDRLIEANLVRAGAPAGVGIPGGPGGDEVEAHADRCEPRYWLPSLIGVFVREHGSR